jgi:predicted enzyme related to lactoylglutathione lyase
MSDLLHGRFVWTELVTIDTKAAEEFYSRVVGWTAEPYPGSQMRYTIWKAGDKKAAEAFYGRVVGWSAEPFPGSDMGYTIWKAGDKGIGGLMELPAEARKGGAPPNWMAYVGVNDVDASAAQAQALGGKLEHPPTDIPSVGRFAVLSDPHGAHFAILRPLGPSPEGPDEPGAVLEISWRELATLDLGAARSFYTALFGWEMLTANDMGPLGVYQEFGRFGVPLGGMYEKPTDMPFPPHWLVYARVGDIQASVAAAKTLGGTVLNGPMEIPGGGLIAQLLDPQGAAFALHQAKS